MILAFNCTINSQKIHWITDLCLSRNSKPSALSIQTTCIMEQFPIMFEILEKKWSNIYIKFQQPEDMNYLFMLVGGLLQKMHIAEFLARFLQF